MGNFCGTNNKSEDGQRHGRINRDIQLHKSMMAREIKLLLLGAGESGKSTIFKQIKIIHHNGYSRDECLVHKEIIYANTIQWMQTLIEASVKFSIPIQEVENRERAQNIANLDTTHSLTAFTAQTAKDIYELWNDPGIKKTYALRSEFQIGDSAEYFFNRAEKLGVPDYIPTEQDVLRCRVKTTGIVETKFEYEKYTIRMIDVGGQRNERKKWIHCFQGVDAVLFVTALSEYDMKCYEDDKTNRMRESMLLFDEIVNSRWFADTPIVIFFNKVDVFKEKIEKTDLNVCFKDYKGGKDFDAACKYIADRFIKICSSENKSIPTHFITATETDEISKLFDVVCRKLIDEQLTATTQV